MLNDTISVTRRQAGVQVGAVGNEEELDIGGNGEALQFRRRHIVGIDNDHRRRAGIRIIKSEGAAETSALGEEAGFQHGVAAAAGIATAIATTAAATLQVDEDGEVVEAGGRDAKLVFPAELGSSQLGVRQAVGVFRHLGEQGKLGEPKGAAAACVERFAGRRLDNPGSILLNDTISVTRRQAGVQVGAVGNEEELDIGGNGEALQFRRRHIVGIDNDHRRRAGIRIIESEGAAETSVLGDEAGFQHGLATTRVAAARVTTAAVD